MSSSYRNCTWLVVLSMPSACCWAAEVYYQPVVTLSSAYNSNVELSPITKQSATGYFADASTVIGIATPTSETTLAPRVLYNYYPSVRDLDRLEGFFNLRGRYTWQRDRLNLNGLYDHRADVNAAQPGAETNTITPGLGTTQPSTGRIQANTTRDWLIFDPSYSHVITPLSSIGVGAQYQRLSYNVEDTSGHVGFNYYMGRLFYSRALDQRTDMSVEGFGSRYVATSIEAHSTAGGLDWSLQHGWTPALKSELSLSYQHVKFEEIQPDLLTQTANAWGANLSTKYQGQASSYTLSVGRNIGPSAAGGVFATAQVAGQYDRDFTPRLHFTTAARYFHESIVAGRGGNNTRNYLTTFARAQWMMTPKIFIAGAYNFVWQKYRADPSSADANVVSLQIGYRGLERQH